MSLTVGEKLGSYEILAPLGAGGMGQVYRARDAKLGREVAIKVLPEEFTQHPQKLARFQREARLLATLNHPGIATLYGVEEWSPRPGGPDRRQPFLVMELVEGETLAERIARGPLPVTEALTISQQIAEALEAAHEKGVIHRDLKPANIKVDPEGHVKVLDFGLAKLAEAEGDSSGEAGSLSPTLSREATRAGVILGTAAYMSPEQAKGKAIDKRTDIFSFGIVLYEMLTGRRAFSGEDVSDVLASILKTEPDWKVIPSDLDPRVQNLLRRCLRKDRKNRLQAIGDVRVEIEDILTNPLDESRTATTVAPERASVWRPALLAAIGSAAVASLGWWFAGSGGVEPQPVRRFPITLPPSVELPPNSGTLVAISPDGQTLVYRVREDGVPRLYRRSLDQLEAVPIPGTEYAAFYPFFSPDGQWLGFRIGTTVMKVALAGGRPARVAELSAAAWMGASWGPDDAIVAATGPGGLVRFSASGGEPMSIAIPEDTRQYRYPQILPGGRAVLFTATLPKPDGGDIVLLDLETGTSRTLISGGAAGRYVPTGHLVFVRGGDVWATRFDLNRLEVTGTAAVVEPGVRVESGGAVQMAIAGDGPLVYIPGGASAYAPRTLVWVDRRGGEEAIDMPPHTYRYVRLSPDGSRVAVEIRERENDVWIWDLARETLARLTFGGTGGAPVWTPDGTRLAFAQERQVYWQRADGSGTPEPLAEAAERLLWPRSFSPDGRHLLLSETTYPCDIHLLELGNESEPSYLLGAPSFDEFNPEVSPDDRWLAYESDESGRDEIYVRPFPDVSSGRWQISTAGGTRPLWSRDGRELFYLAAPGTVMAVPILDTTAGFSAGRPEMVIEGDYVAGAAGRTYDVSPDGRRFLMVKDVESDGDAPPAQIVIVQNWHEELKRLVPED